MKKSLIISWIANCDYPLFRLWLEKYGSFFDEIIIYWDIQFRYPFYNAFIQQSLSHIPNIKFIDKVEGETNDWRHTATTELIKHATGDWIYSIEQDWFSKNWEGLLASCTGLSFTGADLFGWMNPTNAPYIHPAFWAIKRELLEKTSKDFSAHPEINGSDHFAQITYDVRKLGAKITSLQDLGYNCNFHTTYDEIEKIDAFHLGGVNQNYLNGLTEGFQFHRAEPFMVYNYECRQIDILQDPRFLALSQDIEYKLLPQFSIDIRDNQWTKFFKL